MPIDMMKSFQETMEKPFPTGNKLLQCARPFFTDQTACHSSQQNLTARITTVSNAASRNGHATAQVIGIIFRQVLTISVV
ncbi:MAG: hypothetical protein LIQ31_02720 [Planctomycetes bacterium]|nr:hypothetical protein [Planctomycetota bacterium]